MQAVSDDPEFSINQLYILRNVVRLVWYGDNGEAEITELTVYVETTELRYHRTGVDLAHITTSVGLLQLTNVQAPRAVDDFLRCLATPRHSESAAGRSAGPGTFASLIGNRDTCIMRHDPGVYREDCLIRVT